MDFIIDGVEESIQDTVAFLVKRAKSNGRLESPEGATSMTENTAFIQPNLYKDYVSSFKVEKFHEFNLILNKYSKQAEFRLKLKILRLIFPSLSLKTDFQNRELMLCSYWELPLLLHLSRSGKKSSYVWMLSSPRTADFQRPRYWLFCIFTCDDSKSLTLGDVFHKFAGLGLRPLFIFLGKNSKEKWFQFFVESESASKKSRRAAYREPSSNWRRSEIRREQRFAVHSLARAHEPLPIRKSPFRLPHSRCL